MHSLCHLEIMHADAGCWRARLRLADGPWRELSFQFDKDHRPPELLDGLLAATLPLALRRGAATLHVHGSITRGALWRLTEFARIWNCWSPRTCAATRIEADEVRDELQPSVEAPALVAWSGSLASTHTLVRLRDRLAPGAPEVAGVIRIIGIRPGDEAGLAEARQAAEASGLRFHVIRTDALENGFIDPMIGRLPVVSAALHALGIGHGCGIHARGCLLAAHRLYPRPGPAFPDLLCGDTFPIRADGGFVPPPVQAAEIAPYPALVASVRLTTAGRPRSERVLTRLAFRAAGHVDTGLAGYLLDTLAAAALPLADPRFAAESEATLQAWHARDRVPWLALGARVNARRAFVLLRDVARWLLSATRLGPVYPR